MTIADGQIMIEWNLDQQEKRRIVDLGRFLGLVISAAISVSRRFAHAGCQPSPIVIARVLDTYGQTPVPILC